MSAVFSQNLRRVDFQDFWRFVAVRSLTADSSLLQPMTRLHGMGGYQGSALDGCSGK